MEKDTETTLLHTPFEKADPYNAINMPVYKTAAYQFNSAEAMEDAFCGRSSDHLYSRISNPTVRHFESRVRAVTKAAHVTAFNSGMAAISNLFMTLAYAGANIVTSRHLFGNTYSFFKSTLADFGVEVRFCDLTVASEVEKQIDANTCALFVEIITNPQLEVANLSTLATLCKAKQVPLVADTTIIPFTIFNAQRFGIDLEVISSTKYISGGASSLGGLIVDYATFDWKQNRKLAPLALQHGPNAFAFKLNKEILRNFGAYMSPDAAQLQSAGLDTLQLRFERQANSALALAQALSETDGICSVNYTGLPSNRFYELSNQQFGALPGAMLTFDLASRETCFNFLNKLKLIRRATNLFDTKSLALQVASTIYGTFSETERQAMSISQNTIRMSVGLESVTDLLADIKQALR